MSLALPWLHPQRADVLAALALAMHQRQPLAPGFARLAEGDPLLRPWSDRLGPDLAGGAPLGTVLRRHRLLDRRAAASLDAAGDPVAEFERLTQASLLPVRGLWLIRWFPVALMAAILLPVALAQLSGVAATFAVIYRDLNIKLPALTSLMLDRSCLGVPGMAIGTACMWLLLAGIGKIRGLRHLRHLWWVEVQRQSALLDIADAAIAGADGRPDRDPPWWLRVLLFPTAWRPGRPGWDRAWRTWRILTRFRSFAPDWSAAARAGTAVGLLQAIGLLAADADQQALARLRAATRERLAQALETARAEAAALLLVGFALGLTVAVISFFLPLLSILSQLGGA